MGSSPTFGRFLAIWSEIENSLTTQGPGGAPGQGGAAGAQKAGEGRREMPLLNERIRDREVRLIDEEGNQLGILNTREALGIARERGYDLFLVQPDASPPVARIMDYGRYKFEQEKRAREAKKKHHIVDVKEIKMRYKIEEHDYQTKLRHAKEFLTDGDKVKVLIMLRGREVQHKDLALSLMAKFWKELEELAIMDREAKLEGKSVIMILAPNPQRTRQ
ncbi:MAG: translation initiation factor IF-3 [Candidatus Obscuribacterales bacterium]|nr:translation initiation factor IF-3 [Candidatus Obscuribacterales bacterium]